MNKLLARGRDITNHSPNYHFTKINEIKPDMLKEAAQNARIAANEFADNAGAKVGEIRSASQSGFMVGKCEICSNLVSQQPVLRKMG